METRTSWQIQKAVVKALFLRELKTRFGSRKFGYFWAIMEPAAIIVVFWVMFGLSLRKSLPGVDYPMFLMTGMVPWQLFSQIVTGAMNAFEANAGLFNYRQVKPIDTLLARALVESIVYLLVFMIFMAIGQALGYQAAVHNLLGLLLTLLHLLLFSFSLGLLYAVIGSFSDNFKKVAGIIMRPLFFSSGIFFAVDMVPEKYKWMLLWNPVLHFLELIRTEYFETFQTHDASHIYTLYWTISLAAMSLWLYTRLKNRILASS